MDETRERLQNLTLKTFARAIKAATDGDDEEAGELMQIVTAMTGMEADLNETDEVEEDAFDQQTRMLFRKASSIASIKRNVPEYLLIESFSIENRIKAIKGIEDRKVKINRALSLARNVALAALIQNPTPLLGSLVEILPDLAELTGKELN